MGVAWVHPHICELGIEDLPGAQSGRMHEPLYGRGFSVCRGSAGLLAFKGGCVAALLLGSLLAPVRPFPLRLPPIWVLVRILGAIERHEGVWVAQMLVEFGEEVLTPLRFGPEHIHQREHRFETERFLGSLRNWWVQSN